jgi:hypothetical protein
MDYPSACEHSGWFRDVRAIIDLSEVVHGLPLPTISPDRATFRFTGITHAEDARSALDCAKTILEAGLGVVFPEDPVPFEAGSAKRSVYTALMPSGLEICLVAWTKHLDGGEAPQDVRPLVKAA